MTYLKRYFLNHYKVKSINNPKKSLFYLNLLKRKNYLLTPIAKGLSFLVVKTLDVNIESIPP